MSIDPGDTIKTAPESEQLGEVEVRLGMVENRRFRGARWYSAQEVVDLCRFADDRIGLLRGEIDRQRRDSRELSAQIEMLRHGALPSRAAPQQVDPMVVELTMRAQDEVNRTIGEASAEGAEIIADARAQAQRIVADAYHRAASAAASGMTMGAGVEDTVVQDLRRRVREFEQQQTLLQDAVAAAQEQLSQWHDYLLRESDQLRQSALAAVAANQKFSAILPAAGDR